MTNQRALRLGTLGFMLLFAALLSACAEPPWFAFKPADGSFRASFPMEPTKSIKTVNTALGETDVTFYTTTEKQIAYTVTVADFPEEQVKQLGPTAFLDRARDGQVSNAHGKLVAEKAFDLKGNPGREFRIVVTGGKQAFQSRLILVGNRVFQVFVVCPPDDADSSPVKRFLDGFSLP